MMEALQVILVLGAAGIGAVLIASRASPSPRARTDERLSPSDVRRVTRRIEREMGVRFDGRASVEFMQRLPGKDRYGDHTAAIRRADGRLAKARIRIYDGVPRKDQELVLRHELRELAGMMKGKSQPQAHKAAQQREAADIRNLNLRNDQGKPYKNTVRMLRQHDRRTCTHCTTTGFTARMKRGMRAW